MTEPSSPSPPLPRLSVIHFLVWMSLTALVLFQRRLLSGPADSITGPGLEGSTGTGIEAVLDGANLGGILLLIAWRWRGISFPKHPGEWLLVMQGAVFLLNLAINLASWAGLTSSFPAWRVGETVTLTLPVLAFLAPAILCKCSPGWRLFFWSLVAVQTLQLVEYARFEFGTPPAVKAFHLRMVVSYAVCVSLLALTVVSDLLRRRRFQWPHWLGVATISVSLVLALCVWIIEFNRP